MKRGKLWFPAMIFLLAATVITCTLPSSATAQIPYDSGQQIVEQDPNPIMATNTENIKNIVFIARSTTNSITSIEYLRFRFYLRNISLSAYTPSVNITDCQNMNISGATASYGSPYEVNCSYYPTTILPAGSNIAECYFDTTTDFMTAMEDIVGIEYSYDTISGTTTTGLAYSAVLLGDANGDGSVNSLDANRVLQSSIGSVTLSVNECVAADVNRDGTINSADSLMINQYTVKNITSFWNFSSITTTENPNITSGESCRIQNTYSKNYLRQTTSNSTIVASQRAFGNNVSDLKFKFYYLGSGLYKIINENSGLALTYTSTGGDNKLRFSTYSNVSTQKWYVEGSGSSFYLINASSKTKFVSA